MNPLIQSTASLWPVITHMGSASLVLPIFAITAVSLWQVGQRNAVRVWLLGILLAVAMTLLTKILFMGWGIGVSAVDFTGISGHTLLVTSVLPVLLGLYLTGDQGNSSRIGLAAGLLIGAMVGISRVILGAHSISEVAVAWFLGTAVSTISLRAMNGRVHCPWYAKLTPLIFLLALHTPSSTYLRTHDWEVALALALSGHERPFTRNHLTTETDRINHELPKRVENMDGPGKPGAAVP